MYPKRKAVHNTKFTEQHLEPTYMPRTINAPANINKQEENACTRFYQFILEPTGKIDIRSPAINEDYYPWDILEDTFTPLTADKLFQMRRHAKEAIELEQLTGNIKQQPIKHVGQRKLKGKEGDTNSNVMNKDQTDGIESLNLLKKKRRLLKKKDDKEDEDEEEMDSDSEYDDKVERKKEKKTKESKKKKKANIEKEYLDDEAEEVTQSENEEGNETGLNSSKNKLTKENQSTKKAKLINEDDSESKSDSREGQEDDSDEDDDDDDGDYRMMQYGDYEDDNDGIGDDDRHGGDDDD
ncbi:MAG: hypothetical protein EZS28_027978 [Streblomastix strix]|uniref:Uncharacterized protein n=1 Tax=Streblomastix strix TaxID=222440 RepID=A0A5J4V0I8_9EUKA|nr:MAG: hypothetical protein EZS28_027978 [Streblomastix strix]